MGSKVKGGMFWTPMFTKKKKRINYVAKDKIKGDEKEKERRKRKKEKRKKEKRKKGKRKQEAGGD
jgi:hypothetical protein